MTDEPHPLKIARIRRWYVVAIAALAVTSTGPLCMAAGHSGGVLDEVKDVPLPGSATRFDYQSIDTTTNRLYLSHMGAGELVAYDLESGRIEGIVRDLPRVTGVWAVHDLGKVYASVPGDHQVAVIDARTLRVEARVGNVGFPDGIAYAPKQGRVYVSDESGGGELVIDGPTNEVVTTIPLGGEAGNTLFDPGTGQVLVAVQTRDEIVEVDPGADTVRARHVLRGAVRPHGLALDPKRRLLFVADEDGATLLTVDLESMSVVAKNAVGEDPDVLAYDVGMRRLYVASESGRVSIFTVRDRRLVPEGEITMPHAHSVSVDPRTHLVYFPLQGIRGRPVLRVMRPRLP